MSAAWHRAATHVKHSIEAAWPAFALGGLVVAALVLF